LHLQTRFAQLETASVLHRYTEGFRTVEDIYQILQISQARMKNNPDIPPPKAKLMANYYEKLTTLFWVSENYLFHAFAWYKYYDLCREFNRGMSEETKRMQASAVLLAALCIPSTPNQAGAAMDKQHAIGSTFQDDLVKQKMGRMATLLDFNTRNPTREALLLEIKNKNILDQVPEYLRELYVVLENNADPLIMVEKARPLLEQLKAEVGATTTTDSDNDDVKDTSLGRYVEPLTKVLLLKLIVNLSAAYHTVSMDHLKLLTSGLAMTFEQVEKAIVLLTQTKTLTVRIDHRAGCLRFGDANLESDAMRSQLTILSNRLDAVNQILEPWNVNSVMERRHKFYNEVRSNFDSEYEAVIERKNLIEKRKEEAERMVQEKAREEARKKAEEEALRRADEEKRMVREQKLRELEKQKKIQLELDNQEKKRFLIAMGKKTDEISDEQMALIDTKALQKEHQDEINKKKEEAEQKTREAAKKLDYLVRAIRIEELPLIKQKYEEKIKADRERYEKENLEKAKQAKLAWEKAVEDRKLMYEFDVFKYFSSFEESIMKSRKVQHEDACRVADERAEIAAEKDKFKRARQRKHDEAKRIADEAERRQNEIEEKKAEEEKLKREEALKERKAKEEQARQTENRRMDDERNQQQPSRTGAGSGDGTTRYVPPALRGQDGGGGDRGGNRFGGGGGSYPGGGRYDGPSRGSDDRGAGVGSAWRTGGGRPGSSGDRPSSSGGYGDRRGGDDRPGSSGDRGAGGYGDRRGGDDRPGSSGDRGTGGYGDRRGGDDRPGSFGDRGAGGYGDRRGGDDRPGSFGDRGAGGYGDRRGGDDRRDGSGGNRFGGAGPRSDDRTSTIWRQLTLDQINLGFILTCYSICQVELE
jgi:translation initiation factor 3 subunit A